MAITEADYLLLQDLNRAQVWMLLGSEKQFHLVRVDASLTEQKYERLMKRYEDISGAGDLCHTPESGKLYPCDPGGDRDRREADDVLLRNRPPVQTGRYL